MSTIFESVVSSPSYQKLKKETIKELKDKLSAIQSVKPGQSDKKSKYEEAVKEVGAIRGRDLYYKYIASGAGNGPFVEMADGAIKYDLITGIGVNFFGHANMEMYEAIYDSLWCDVMQGNLGPGPEYHGLLKDLIDAAAGSKIKHAWLTTCGATANEIALKILRQKKSPATKVFAFKDCFAGRTTALQEITDNPAYRQGQPVYGEVSYLNFYDPHSKLSPAQQAEVNIARMKEEVARYPGKYALLVFEPVQGEGGFTVPPKEFIYPVLKEAKNLGIGIWADEVQTFGRTGEVFAFKKMGLEDVVDVVTIGKMLQSAAVLFSEEFNPKAGLVSGTFAGSSASLAAARWTLKVLNERFIGPKGRIAELEKLTTKNFEELKSSHVGQFLKDYTVYGGMVAFTPFRGTLDDVKKLLMSLYEEGVIAFYCGHGPYRIRMLPPFGVITNEQWKDVFSILKKSIEKTAKEIGLA